MGPRIQYAKTEDGVNTQVGAYALLSRYSWAVRASS